MQSNFSEKTLEEIIFKNRDKIHEYGFEVLLPNTFRQFRLDSGKIIDILSYDITETEILLYVIELKKGRTFEALEQAYGYMDELLFELKPRFDKIYSKVILVGNEVTPTPLLNFLAHPTETYTYDYTIDGIVFNMVTSNCDVAINDRKIQ